MKNTALLLFLIFGFTANAQDWKPSFIHEYYECENHWVVLPKEAKDSTHIYGFVYMDRQAGFTLGYEGTLSISDKGEYKAYPADRNTHMIFRFPSSGYALLSLLPDDKREQMGLPKEPKWLANYRQGEDDTDQLVRKGFIYNDVGGSKLALPVLLKAYAREPHAKGLEFELAFAYNATGQFENAVDVLNKAIENDPSNYMFLRELGYSYIHMGLTDKAESTYRKAIAMGDDAMQKAEMAFNMAGIYYRDKNKAKFAEWDAEVKKYAPEDSIYYKQLIKLEENFNQ